MTPTYTASARVYFSTEAPRGGPGQADNIFLITTADLETYIEVMSSPLLEEAIREDLALDDGATFSVTAATPGNTPVLDITATAATPELAAGVANAAGPQLAEVAQQFSLLLAGAGQSVASNPIDPATAPASPSSPDVRRSLALGFLVGIAAGTGLAFAQHGLDRRIRDASDLRQLSEQPVLASVPLDEQHPVVMVSRPRGVGAESIRRLRTNLKFVDVATARHSVLFTSALAGEGKTTTAINLAIAMSDAGSRVLLVDADLRKPTVAANLGLPGEVGLTTALLGEAEIEDAAQQWRDSSLYVLPAGPIPPNPSELIGSKAMRKLFKRLSRSFDVLVVDSPPVLPVVDAVLLGKLTGGTVMVVGLDKIRKHHLGAALGALETAGVPVSGFVLNKAPLDGAAASYRYYSAHPLPADSSPAERPQRGRRRQPADSARSVDRPSAPSAAGPGSERLADVAHARPGRV